MKKTTFRYLVLASLTATSCLALSAAQPAMAFDVTDYVEESGTGPLSQTTTGGGNGGTSDDIVSQTTSTGSTYEPEPTEGLNGQQLYFNNGDNATNLIPRDFQPVSTTDLNSSMQKLLAADPSLQAKLDSLKTTALGAASIVELAKDPQLAANMMKQFTIDNISGLATGLQNTPSLLQLNTTIQAIGSPEALAYYMQNTQLSALTQNQYWTIYHEVIKNPDFFKDNAMALFAGNSALQEQMSALMGVSLAEIQSMNPQDMMNAASEYLAVDISGFGLNATQVAGLLKGDFSSVESMAKDKLVGLLASLDSEIVGQLDLGQLQELFSDGLGGLANIGTDELQGFLASLDPSIFEELGSEGFAELLGMDEAGLADALGVDLEELQNMDSAEFASLTDTFLGSSGNTDLGSLFGSGGSGGTGGIGGILTGSGGTGGGIGGIFGGGGSGAAGSPLVPHG